MVPYARSEAPPRLSDASRGQSHHLDPGRCGAPGSQTSPSRHRPWRRQARRTPSSPVPFPSHSTAVSTPTTRSALGALDHQPEPRRNQTEPPTSQRRYRLQYPRSAPLGHGRGSDRLGGVDRAPCSGSSCDPCSAGPLPEPILAITSTTSPPLVPRPSNPHERRAPRRPRATRPAPAHARGRPSSPAEADPGVGHCAEGETAVSRGTGDGPAARSDCSSPQRRAATRWTRACQSGSIRACAPAQHNRR
jgi:hypothetical protein